MALEETLRLVVEATTGRSDAEFGKLTTAAERTATAADAAAEAVAGAADRVAQARNKEADAAGKLAVAEAKLEEVRARYGEGSSQLIAAQERVASAQRGVQLAAANTANALEQQEAAQQGATTATEQGAAASEEAGRGAQRFRDEVSGVRDQVVGLVAGLSLADWMSESVTGFVEGARGASSLAMSMNATVEEGGRFLGVAQALGLEMDDLLEIQASFAQVVEDDADALASMGAEVKLNKDGTTNWALTLQDALGRLQQIPDATKRNALGFRLFGEEGYKQMSRLLLSGKSVDEVFAAMGTPYGPEDVEAARRYEEAMAELSSTAGAAGRELGSVLVPIITAVVSAFSVAGDVIGAIPGPMLIVTGVAIALGLANRVAAESGGLLAAALGGVTTAAMRASTAVGAATVGTGALATTMGVARVAAGGMSALLGGPLGIALIAVGGAFALLNSSLFETKAESDEAAEAQQQLTAALEESNGVINDNVRRKAALAAQESGLLETARAAGVAEGDVTDAILGNAEAYDRVTAALAAYRQEGSRESNLGVEQLDAQGHAAKDAEGSLAELAGTNRDTAESSAELAGELEETTDKSALAQAALETLTAAVEAGGTSTEELTRLAAAAALAERDQAAASDTAKAAIEAYKDTTWGAAEATLALYEAQLGQRQGLIGVQEAWYNVSQTVDDAKTPWNEVEAQVLDAIGTTITYAGTAADAAVAAAQAAGTALTPLAEAKVRAEATIAALKASLDDENMTAGGREQIGGLIAQLETAAAKGDIEALVTLTGGEQVAGELDETTEDRDTEVRIETRNGPAVIAYIDTITNADRLALVRVESRNGPATNAYIDGIAHERLAIIRIESRGGPAVQRYLDELTGTRNVTVNATRGSGAPATYGAPALAGVAGARVAANVTLDLELTGRIDRGQLTAAERGRAVVSDVRAYEQRNGTGWRRG